MVNNFREVASVDKISETRLWKALDSILDKVSVIETQLAELVRLEERVNHHDQALHRFGSRIDNHDIRIREAELWQANQGDRSSVERLITNIQEEIKDVRKEVDQIKSTEDVNKGQKDVGKEILKWVVGLLTVILIYIIKGS